MGEGIKGKPNTYDFGLDFNYAVWPKGTVIEMVNVPWNNDYRDVVRKPTQADFDAYIDSRAPAGIKLEKMSQIFPGRPIRINTPYNRAIKHNYLRVTNPLMPIDGDERKTYYYFILDVNYISGNTTELVVQLDVWSTYVYDVTVGRCYVERGHIGMANSRQMDAYGRNYLTVPEGLDVGGEYRTIAKRTNEIMGFGPSTGGLYTYNYNVLIACTVDIEDPGTEAAPNLVSSKGSFFEGLAHGAQFYLFKNQEMFMSFMDLYSDKPWVTQGIISISIVPPIERYHPEFWAVETPWKKADGFFNVPKRHHLFLNWRNSEEINNKIPARYRGLKKLWTYPYMVLQMTTWTATPVALKPESFQDPDASFIERATLTPPSQSIEFWPRRYNANPDSELENWGGLTNAQLAPLGALGERMLDVGDDAGDYLDVMTKMSNMPKTVIVNDGAISYLASNLNSIAYQRTSSDWTQQRALGMASGQYDIATQQIQTAQSLAGIQGNADISQTANVNRTQAAQAVTAAAGAAAQGLGQALTPAGFGGSIVSGAVQAAQTGVNAGIQIGANDEALSIRQRSLAQTTIANDRQSRMIRDTNKGLADWGARGDYANAIAGINAKVQDAAMIQPTVSGQLGGETTNIIHGTAEFSVRWKLIDDAAIRVVGEYWLRYGYAIRASITPPRDLMVMSRFTYWKMSETYIQVANMPEGFKQAFRGILEKGVTVWRNPEDIGVIDWATNAPLGGISY